MSTRDVAQAFWTTRLLLLSAIPILGLVARAEDSDAQSAADVSAVPNGGYIGSEACTECHSDIYEAWRSTRHSYSILTAVDAKRADYPLPHKHDVQTPHNRDWETTSGKRRLPPFWQDAQFCDARHSVLGM